MVFPISDPFDTNEQKQFRTHCHTSLQKVYTHRQAFIASCNERPELCELGDRDRRTEFGIRVLLGIHLSASSRLPSNSVEDFLQNHNISSPRNDLDPLAEVLSIWPDFDLEAYVERRQQSTEFTESFKKDYLMIREMAFEFRKLRQSMATAEATRGWNGDLVPIFQSFQEALFTGIKSTDMEKEMKIKLEKARMRQVANTPETVF